MAFREYLSKGLRVDFWRDSVVVTNNNLIFGEDFWKDSLGQCERVRLFFDEEARKIGIMPVKPGEGLGLKIQYSNRRNPAISWVAFLKRFNLFFDGRQVCPIENSGDPKEKMKIMDLSHAVKIEEK